MLTRRMLMAHTAVALASAAGLRAQISPRLRKIAVTIDDGPATGANRDLDLFVRISDGLRAAFVAEKIPAIMFVNERLLNVDGQRDARVATLNRWLEAGLEVGNHTYSHPNLNSVDLPRYLDDIVKGEVITRPLLEARGKKLEWFRYPFLAAGHGEKAKAVEDFLAQRGYRVAPVSVDYHDYEFASVYRRHSQAGDEQRADEQFVLALQALDAAFARAELKSREVLGYDLPQVLLIHCSEMNAITLRRTIQRIRERGYAFVSLEEAMTDPAYHLPGIPPGGLGNGGLLNTLAAAKRAAENR